MRFIIPGRLPCMNDLIAANRLNKYAGAGVKKKTQKEIILILRPQTKGRKFNKKVNIRIEYYEKDMRRDEDNVMSAAKFILDALQDIELIQIRGDELCRKGKRKQRYSTVLLISLV